MRSYRKDFVWLMLIMFLFAQVLPVSAASTQYQDPNANAQPLAPTFANNSPQAVSSAADQLSNYYFTQYKNSFGWDWLKTTNINFSAFSGGTPQWNINTFQPLTLKSNLDKFFFVQGQYGTSNNTVNVGLGYRTMNPAHSSLYGFNLFYDWQTTVQGMNGYNPNGSHMRLGAGLEYFTGSIEARANGYYGVSPDVQVSSVNTSNMAAFQHVAPGADLSIGTDFSFWNAPWFKLTATGNYYAQTQGGSINGYNGSPVNANLTAQLQVTPQLSVNAGGSLGNGASSNGNFGFQFNLLAPPTPALLLADPTTNKLADTDISYKMLQQVQRNNTITVEQYSKDVGNLQAVAFAFVDENGDPLPGAVVTATVTSVTGAVGSSAYTAVTNAAGIANLSLPSGATGTLSAQTGIAAMASTFNLHTAPTPPALPFDLSGYGKQAIDKAAFDAAEAAAGLNEPTTTIGTSNAGNGTAGTTVKVSQLPVVNNNYIINGLPAGTFPTMNINGGGAYTQFAANAPSANPAAIVDSAALAAALNGPSATSLNLTANFSNGTLAKGTKILQITADAFQNQLVFGSLTLDSGTATVPYSQLVIPALAGATSIAVTITSSYENAPMVTTRATLTLGKQNNITINSGTAPTPGTATITVNSVYVNGAQVTGPHRIGYIDASGTVSQLQTFDPLLGATATFSNLNPGVYFFAVFNNTTRVPTAIDLVAVPVQIGSSVTKQIAAATTGAYNVSISGMSASATGTVTISNIDLPQIINVNTPFVADANGNATVNTPGMPCGVKSIINVSATGYAQQTFSNVQISPSTYVANVPVTMAASTNGTIQLNYTWPAGAIPASGKVVLVNNANPEQQISTLAPTGASCTFNNVTPGTYTALSYFPGAAVTPATVPVIAGTNNSVTMPPVVLTQTGNVVVNIHAVIGTEATGNVSINSTDGSINYYTGSFDAANGNYTLTATQIPVGPVVVATTLTNGSPYYLSTAQSSQAITVANNSSVGVPVTLELGSIAGAIQGLATPAGVVVTLDGATITPAWSGLNYVIANVTMGTHTLALNKSNYTAAPLTQSVNITDATANQRQQLHLQRLRPLEQYLE